METKLLPITNQSAGIITFENFNQLKENLEFIISNYKNVVYTSQKDAKADEKKLKALRKELKDKLKEVKELYMEPFNNFEAEIKSLIAMINEPLKEIDAYLSEIDIEKRNTDIKKYYDSISLELGAYKDILFNSPAFIDKRWFYKSMTIKKYHKELADKVNQCLDDIQVIQLSDSPNKDVLMARYFECLNIDEVKHLNENLNMTYDGTVESKEDEDMAVGFKTLKINGSYRQMEKLYKFLELNGMTFEEIEDGMPKE